MVKQKYTLVNGELKRDGRNFECPFSNPPAEYIKSTCGDWCPAFQYEERTMYGVKENDIRLACFPQEVIYKIESEEEQ